MKKILVAYDSKTGRTQKMAEDIAKGVEKAGVKAVLQPISDINNAEELKGYDGFLFGCPTYFKDATDDMKNFLFMAKKGEVEGKLGGAFGSYSYIGNGPKIVHETMQYVFNMDMGQTAALNVKEQIVDSGKGEEPCLAFGRAMAEKLQ